MPIIYITHKEMIGMKNKRLTSILYLISGALFFVAAFIGKNYVFIPIGCCFIVLGITDRYTKKDDKSK